MPKGGKGRKAHEEGRYRAIFNSAADAILVADRQNRFTDANAAAADLLGTPRDEILAQSCSNIFAFSETGHVCFMREVIFRGETRRDVEQTVLTPARAFYAGVNPKSGLPADAAQHC